MKPCKLTVVPPTIASNDEVIPRGVACTFSNQEDFHFQALTWETVDEGPMPVETERYAEQAEPRNAVVYIVGLTRQGHSVSVRVPKQPFFMLKLGPDPWSNAQIDLFLRTDLLNQTKVVQCVGDVEADQDQDNGRVVSYRALPDNEKALCSFRSAFMGYEVVWMHDLDAGFTGIEPKKFQFLKLRWKTDVAKRKAGYRAIGQYMTERLAQKGLCVKLYESALQNHIRLMHETCIESTGWARVVAGGYTFVKGHGSARIQIELKNHDYASYLKPSDQQGVAPIRQCSVDLETYSAVPGRFPDASNKEDCIFQISNYFVDYGSDTSYTVLLHTKDMDPLPATDEWVRVVRCESEMQLLQIWLRLIHHSEVDLLHAYNGFGFDFLYILTRAKRYPSVWNSLQQDLTRIHSMPASMYTKELKSDAYGANTWTLIQMAGRVTFDPMVHIKREFRRNNNSLNAVSADYLSYNLPSNPLSCVDGSPRVTVHHPNHPFGKGDVVHLMGVDTPVMERNAQDGTSQYVLAGFSFDDWFEELHDIVDVVDKDHYVIRMVREANATIEAGGGNSVRAFESKHDVTAQQMFDAYRTNDSAMLAKVGLYCIQDTKLPQRIIDKLSILPFLLEVAKVCWVPIAYLITHGQQIKFHSQISKAAAEANYAVHAVIRPYKSDDDPVEPEDDDEPKESYVGGAVLDPVIGFHVEPVAVPDYKSLYPSRMIDGNYSYDTLVKDPCYLDLPGVAYHSVHIKDGPNGEFDRTHTFAQHARGIVPRVLMHLLRARVEAKGQLKRAKTPMERANFDAKQLALKISANSIYGATGAEATGKLPCKAIAESTTATGRDATFFARDYAVDTRNFATVMACTTHFPTNYVYWMCAPKWDETGGTVDRVGSGYFPMSIAKLMAMPAAKRDALQVWGTAGWTTIVGFDTDAETGFVQVQMANGHTVDMQHYRCCTYNETENTVQDRVVYGDSVTGDTPCLLQHIATGRIVIQPIDQVVEDASRWVRRDDGKDVAVDVPYRVWTEDGWTAIRQVIRHCTQKTIHRVVTHTGVVDCTSDHGLVTSAGERVSTQDVHLGDMLLHAFPGEFPAVDEAVMLPMVIDKAREFGIKFSMHKIDRVPCWILNGSEPVRRAFWNVCNRRQVSVYGKCAAAGLYYIGRSLGYNVSVDTRNDTQDNVFILRSTHGALRKNPYGIKRIRDVTVQYAGEYVYDFETDNHHFQAGVGQLIVHNTDSIFTKFDTSHLDTMEAKLIYSMCVAAYISDEITQRLHEQNPHWPPKEQYMELEYEKTFARLFLFSKKRYTGKKVEFNPYKFATISMGVSDKRRDFCLYVKEIYRRILDVAYDLEREWTRAELVERALAVLKVAIEDLLNNRVPFNKLKISKLLTDEYAMREVVAKKRKRTGAQKYTFGPHNVFVGDYVMVKGDDEPLQVVALDAQVGPAGRPVHVVNPDTGASGLTRRVVRYSEIARKCKSRISLARILDPATPEPELAGITHAHVRLARKMYARDPGTAPKSGDRVPFVFCELAEGADDGLQWRKAEDPEFARRTKRKVDPVYYLQRQCEKGWSQIINTVQPGKADAMFAEAYHLYDKRKRRQPNIDRVWSVGLSDAQQEEIRLGENQGRPKKKRAKKTPPPIQKNTLQGWLRAK